MTSQGGGGHIMHVDSVLHAESIIKSLRSASLSNRRYQRTAAASDDLEGNVIPTLANFDSLVVAQLQEVHKKQEIDAKIDAVPMHTLNRTKKHDFDGMENNSDEDEEYSPRNKGKVMSQVGTLDSDSSDDEYAAQKRSNPRSNATNHHVTAAVMNDSLNRSITRDRDDDCLDDDDDQEDDRELFRGFVAPRGADEDEYDAPVYKRPNGTHQSSSQSKAAGASIGGPSGAKTSKFSSKLAATVSGSKAYQSHCADFSAGNSRVIVKPGQRIVVKARGRKSNMGASYGGSTGASEY